MQTHGDLSQFSTPDKIALAKDAVLIAGTVGGIGFLASNSPVNPHTKPQASLLETNTLQDDKNLVMQELSKRGFIEDKEEKALWQNPDLKPILQPFNPKNPEDRQTVAMRFVLILDTMKKSKINVFRQAANNIEKHHRNEKDLIINFAEDLDAPQAHGYYPMKAMPILYDGKFGVLLSIAPNGISKLSAEMLAVFLTHEDRHVQRILQRAKQLSDKTDQEKVEAEESLSKNETFYTLEEADAHAEDLEAYLEFARYGYSNNQFTRNAAEYIRANKDRSSKEWITIIKRDYPPLN